MFPFGGSGDDEMSSTPKKIRQKITKAEYDAFMEQAREDMKKVMSMFKITIHSDE